MDVVYLAIKNFLLVGLMVAVFCFFLLINKKDKRASDKIFIAWFLFLAINLIATFFIEQLSAIFPIIYGIIVFIFTIIHQLFLFFYIKKLTFKKQISNISYLKHFLPVIVIAISVIVWYSNLSYTEQIVHNSNFSKGYFKYTPFLISITIINAFLSLFYIVWSLLLIHEHQKKINDIFFDTKGINLKWAEHFAIGWGLMWIAAIISVLILFIGDGKISFDVYYLGVGSFIFLIFYIGFNGVKQKQIFVSSKGNFPAGNSSEESENTRPLNGEIFYDEKFADNKKYLKSGLKETEAEEFLKRIIDFLEKDKPYLESDIKIAAFANKLDIPPHYVSQIINGKLDKNFYNLINSYRINEFKERLANAKYKNFTILSIALDCGFSSNSSFYRIFKNTEGVSPSEYQKMIRQN